LTVNNNGYEKIIEEIEKVKFHNRSLLTLVGLLNGAKMEKTTIYEAIVMFDFQKRT
jgi:hypothetical protein